MLWQALGFHTTVLQGLTIYLVYFSIQAYILENEPICFGSRIPSDRVSDFEFAAGVAFAVPSKPAALEGIDLLFIY